MGTIDTIRSIRDCGAAVTLLCVSSSSKWCHSYELLDTEKIASLINRETETFFNRLLLYCFIFKDLESTYDMCYEANEWTLGQPFAQWPLKSSQKKGRRCPKSSHLREKKKLSRVPSKWNWPLEKKRKVNEGRRPMV